MSKVKKIFVTLLVFIILALFTCFIVSDFSRFAAYGDYYSNYYASAVLKRITVILAAVIAWIAGSDRLNREDGRIMRLVFLVICSAETAFLFRRFMAGVVLFGVCQSLLIFRNGRGLTDKLAHAGLYERIRVQAAGMLIAAALAAMIVISYKVFGFKNELIAGWIYGAVLSASLWTALANNILGLFPKLNSRMIAAGMFCFYCCDILVGLDAVMQVGPVWLVANSFIWVFYTPAVTLLALSCYRYEGHGVAV